jgi:hypothetical protein
VRAALQSDPLLTIKHRRALLEVYDGVMALNARRDDGGTLQPLCLLAERTLPC